MEQTFAAFVAARRSELGIPLSTFADLVGRSASTVRSWERGRARPGDPNTLRAIAAVLDVDEAHLAALAGGAALPPPPAPEPARVVEAQEDVPDTSEADEVSGDGGSEASSPFFPDADAPDVEPPDWITAGATNPPPQVAVEEADSRRVKPLGDSRIPWLPLPPAHRVMERTDDGLRYPIRIVATLVAIVVLLSILAWSLGEFQAALGDLRTSMFG